MRNKSEHLEISKCGNFFKIINFTDTYRHSNNHLGSELGIIVDPEYTGMQITCGEWVPIEYIDEYKHIAPLELDPMGNAKYK